MPSASKLPDLALGLRRACAGLIFVWAGPLCAAGLECPEIGAGAVPALVSPTQASPLAAGGVDMANEIGELIVRLKTERPKITYAGLTNELIAAYCPVLSAETSIGTEEKLDRLRKFEAILRERLSSEILPPGSQVLTNVALEPEVYRTLRDTAQQSGQTPSEFITAILNKAASETRGK